MERLNPIFRLLNLCGGSFVLCKTDAFHAIGRAMTLYKHYCYEQGKKIPIAFREQILENLHELDERNGRSLF
jgi:hypothetical protein